VSGAERFVEAFERSWGDPARFVDLYHPDAAIRSPASRRLLGRDDVVPYVAAMKAMLPDMQIDVQRWAADGATLFLEWRINATLNGEPIAWEGVSRYTLDGGLAISEAVHFDSLPLWERLDPSMKRRGLLDSREP
jgi:hypothetical protein